MEKNTEAEISSAVATVEDIQKRLLRPPTLLRSQPSSSSLASHRRGSIISQISAKFVENTDEPLKEKKKEKREVTKSRRLEDYLDPVLLSTVRAKLGSKRRNNFYGYGAEIKKKSSKSETYEFDLFEWPGDRHEMEEASISTQTSRAKPEERNDVVVDLNID